LTVDATQILAQKSSDVSPLAVVSKRLVEICRSHPKINSSFGDDAIVLKDEVHLGVATDTERGLMVPVVRNADKLTVEALGKEIKRLITAAREGKSSPDDLRGSTITISNVGSFGAEYGTPIINHPEAAILALGVIEQRPVVRDGVVVALPMVTLSLSFDHRVLDGAEAGRALADLRVLLEQVR
ncbi:MAG: 2-oxo acid dehydrogenase subunit E2, partial [Actinomycetota bacterium]